MESKKLLIFLLGIICIKSLDNGLGLTPQMGWNTWNKFGCSINQTLIRDSIDAMIDSGLFQAGYNYINLDDCWQKDRAEDGTIIPDNITFPDGIKPLVDYAHSKGLYLGLYSSAGIYTCQGRPGSLGYEEIDAKQYAEWEVDYLKYDNCYNNNTPSLDRYPKMGEYLNKTGRPIFYSLCQWGRENVPTWGKKVGNSWRTTDDISDSWDMMMRKIDENDEWYEFGGPGGWNDPDMLEVGNGHMTTTEYKTHFSLWALAKAPLLIGCDITKMTEDTKNILTNPEVIAINQDPLGEQGHKIKRTEIEFPPDYTTTLSYSQLDLTDCDGDINQKWYINSDGSIRNNNENFCIDIPNCDINDVFVETYSCHIGSGGCEESRNQQWDYDPVDKKIHTRMEKEGLKKCLTTARNIEKSIKMHLCNESVTWDYDEAEHTLKHNGKCLTTVQVTEVWAGNLSDGTYALLLLNRGSIASKVQISWKELGLKTSKVKLRDLWERKDLGEYKEKYTAYLASHDSLLFKVFPLDDKEEPEEEVFKVENIVMIVLGAIILIGICAFFYTYLVNRKKQKKDEESKEDKLIDKKE